MGLLAVTAIPLLAQQNVEPIDVVGGDEAALREFISRIFSPVYGGQTVGNPRVLIGELPNDLPYEIPLPDDTRVIGSMDVSEASSTFVLLDSGLSPAEVIQFYEETLPESGWQASDQGNQGVGFTVPAATTGMVFCNTDNYSLTVTVLELGESTDVRIQMSQYSGQCSPSTGMNTSEDANLLPTLEAPAGTIIRSGGSIGGITGGLGLSASLESDLSVEALAVHYNDQLEAQDWTLVRKGSTEGAAWSNWTFSDDNGNGWAGTLMVLETPTGADGRFVFLQIGRIKD